MADAKKTTRKASAVPVESMTSALPTPDSLAGLVLRLEGYLRSARNALALPDSDASKRARMQEEAAKLRRMVHAWLGLEEENELEVRMHFTQGVEFFASVDGTEKGAAHAAKVLISRVAALNPVIASRLDPNLVQAAVLKRTKGRFDWNAMEKAWGRTVNHASWRVEYASRKRARRT